MRTPWGDFPVSDARVHFFSHAFFSSLAAQAGKSPGDLNGLLGWHIPEQDPGKLAAAWVEELDREGESFSHFVAGQE